MICSGGPWGCRIRGHIEMNDLPATVKEDNEAVQNADIDRRDCEHEHAVMPHNLMSYLTR